MDWNIISIVAAIIVLSAALYASIFMFGREMFQREEAFNSWHQFLDWFHNSKIDTNFIIDRVVRSGVEDNANRRERRNEFWNIYGQFTLAVFIVLIIAILLLTKTISAEAGLPILSAISGFAIAKAVSSSATNSSDTPRPGPRE